MLDKSSDRFVELDLLRGVAAMWVVLFHYLTQYSHIYGSNTGGLLGFEFPDGMIGVYLFFMISGFVIFMTIQRCRTGLDFIISRFSRLFPTYWTAIAVTAAVGLTVPLPGQTISVWQVIVNLTMLQAFAYVPPIDGVYWTLAIELCFYCVMLGISVSGLLGRIERCAWCWLVLVLFAHVAGLFSADIPYRVTLLLVLHYAQWFILGIVFYISREKGYSTKRIALIGACLTVEIIVDKFMMLSVMAGLILVFHFCITGQMRPLAIRPLLWLGAISYPLYLTHQMIGYRIMRGLLEAGWKPGAAIAAAVSVALVVATVINLIVERPVQRIIRESYRRWRVVTASVRVMPG